MFFCLILLYIVPKNNVFSFFNGVASDVDFLWSKPRKWLNKQQ